MSQNNHVNFGKMGPRSLLLVLAIFLSSLDNSAYGASIKYPTTFADLYANRHGISLEAWNKINKSSNTLTSAAPSSQVIAGPNTVTPPQNRNNDFQIIHNINSKFDNLQSVQVIYFSGSDFNWASQKVQDLLGPDETTLANHLAGWDSLPHPPPQPMISIIHCAGSNCYSGDAYVAKNNIAYLGLASPDIPKDAWLDNSQEWTKMDAIEFWHSIWESRYVKNQSMQPTQLLMQPNNVMWWFLPPNDPPFWFLSAGEYFAYVETSFNNNLLGYKKIIQRAQNSIKSQIPHYYKDIYPNYGQPFLTNFLNISHASGSDELSWQNGNYYDNLGQTVGARIAEMMIALKGPQIMLQIPDDMSQSLSFADSFKKEFGISWQEATPIISKVLLDEYQNNY